MNQFAIDVAKGLSDNRKHLSSKYFYDKQGDKLFQKIMQLDEYYLTNSEFEILDTYKEEISNSFVNGYDSFLLTEFGAGDGFKTKILLDHFTRKRFAFKYLPIDISQHALDSLLGALKSEFPRLEGYGIRADYFAALKRLNGEIPKILLFLGSNIGNLSDSGAIEFLSQMRRSIGSNDKVLIGFDLKKDPDIIKKAYNDSRGITREFNLNLLERINRELGGEFDRREFEHSPTYDPDEGAARSYIVSKIEQDVYIRSLDRSFHFEKGESIFTEVSRKYDVSEIESLARRSGFKVIANYFDRKRYFSDSLWMPG